MLDRELRRFRESVRIGSYVVTYHGLEQMEEDGLSVLDLESCVLTGLIVERQRDRRTGERKYVIAGRGLGSEAIEVVVKWTAQGRMALLTVFRS